MCQYFNSLMASEVQVNVVLQPALGSLYSTGKEEREEGSDFP